MTFLWEPTAWLLALVISFWQLARRLGRPEPEPEVEGQAVEIIFWRGDDPEQALEFFDAIRGTLR